MRSPAGSDWAPADADDARFDKVALIGSACAGACARACARACACACACVGVCVFVCVWVSDHMHVRSLAAGGTICSGRRHVNVVRSHITVGVVCLYVVRPHINVAMTPETQLVRPCPFRALM